MNEDFVIENKVAKSGLITIDLEKIAGDFTVKELDLKQFLYMELLLKEKDFREALSQHDWTQYTDCVLAVHCSTDAIIASWAYMLVVTHAAGYAKDIVSGSPQEVYKTMYLSALNQHDWTQYEGKRIIIKGCSDRSIPAAAYAYATRRLIPVADRIMYGEACSFVPVWRKPRS